MPRRFPPPWTVERIPGGYILNAEGGHDAPDGGYAPCSDEAVQSTIQSLQEGRSRASDIGQIGGMAPEELGRRLRSVACLNVAQCLETALYTRMG